LGIELKLQEECAMKSAPHFRNLANRRQFLRLAAGATVSTFALPLFAQSGTSQHLDVYKEPTCGCCVNWIDHMEQNGFASTVHHPRNLNSMKADLGIKPEWQSCHTAVTTAGYLFEGHVPARYVSQFLAAPPADALGLAAPGMPMGSPGMEMGNNFSPYDVILMKKDGTAQVYASIKSPADQ